MKRAYSLLNVKEFSENGDFFIFRGMATTPATDRVNDVVDPMGAKFADEIPLLWQHNASKPIGRTEFGKPTKKGIPFTAKIPIIREPGALKDRIDEAIQSIRYRLIGAVSIGFRVLNSAVEFLENGGVKYNETEIFELSLVTIPANAEATISSIKSIALSELAALGKEPLRVVRLNSPSGATEKAIKTIKLKDKDMNIAEQLKAFKAAREEKARRMLEIMDGCSKENVTLNAEQSEEYEGLESEIKSVDQHISRLESLEKLNVEKAKPVNAEVNGNSAVASAARSTIVNTVQARKDLPKGIEFIRYVMAFAAAKGNVQSAYNLARNNFGDSPRVVNVLKMACEIGTHDFVMHQKAAVSAGSTAHATWAAPLIEYNQFAGDFVEYLRPMTIIGKFGNNGIPSLRNVPFNTHIRGATSGGTAQWVGEGKAKPVTAFDFNDVYLGFTKVAGITVLTEELVRFSNPAAEGLVRDLLSGAIIARIDSDFVNPAITATTARPASITNGVSAIASSGNDAEAIRADVAAAMSAYIAANITPTTGVWIMPATVALRLSLMRNALGQREFPDITMMGGFFEGLPVIVSEYVPTVTAGAIVILANASDIWLADDGQVSIDMSTEASIQMDSAPTNASYVVSSDPVDTELVSMFQTNSVAIRAERFINWKKRRAAAVQVIDDVFWGVSGS